MTSRTPHISAMAPSQPAAFETTVISTCIAHERVHWRDKDYRRCVVIEQNYFVKFDDYETLRPRVETQKYIYRYAKSDASAPRVPELLHFFESEGMGYAVMEYINLTFPPVLEKAAEKAAEALKWLSKVPAPPDHALQKLYSASVLLKHRSLATVLGQSASALTRRSRLAPLVEPVRIGDERLIFTQSDMDPSNFGVDNEGKTVLLDFGDVGLLPVSFALYTMSSSSIFTAAVAKCLDLPPCSNLKSMAVMRGYLWVVSDPTLGLDNDGNPRR
ncbi:hypothetical protein J3A83DRAFT_4372740 [Scleroderma citrinum]